MYDKVFEDVKFDVKKKVVGLNQILEFNKGNYGLILFNYKKIIFFTDWVWKNNEGKGISLFIPEFQFFDILDLFESYKIIDGYSFIEKDFKDFSDYDLAKLGYKHDTEVYYYIKFLIKTYSGILEIYGDSDKINFYFEILDKEKYSSYKKQLDLDIYYELIDIVDKNKIDFNIGEFLRYAKIDNDKYKVLNLYLLIMGLSTYKRIYISRFLNFFIDSLDDINIKKSLINIINTSDNFEYSENHIYKFSKFQGNIGYLDDNEIIEENNNLNKINDYEDVIFSFKKNNQKLYIKYRDKKEFLIKEVIFESDYEVVASEMYDSETGIIEKSKIKEKYNKDIDSLSDVKKHLGFNNILLKIFFDGANKDKINFIKNINLKRLENKNINELDVLKYLEDKYK